jgi:hypothetical protein
MARYLSAPWRSKPLLLAIYYLLLTIGYLSITLTFRHYLLSSLSYIVLQFMPVCVYAAGRCPKKATQMFQLSLLFFCFGWARALSLFDMVLKREAIPHR